MFDTPWRQLDEWLWSGRAQGPKLSARLCRLLRYPYAIVRDLMLGDVNLRAMGLVYNTLLTLVPLLAFSIAVLKIFGEQDSIELLVYEFFRPVGTAAFDITVRVMSFVTSVSSGLVGSIGFILLLWVLLGTLQKVEDSFNYLWRVEQPRSIGRRVAEYLLMMVAAPVMIAVAFRLGVPAPMVVAVFFVVIYRFLPNTRVHWLAALGGALVAGTLWWLLAQVFADLYANARNITIVYAGFALFIAALVWTWAGWLILLIGVQVSFYLQNPGYLRVGLGELRLSATEIEDLALRIMLLVGRSHLQGSRRWRNGGLSQALRVPGIAVAQVTAMLEQAKLLALDDKQAWLPARGVDRIQLKEILRVVRNPRKTLTERDEALPLPAVDALCDEIRCATENALGERTLNELIEAPP